MKADSPASRTAPVLVPMPAEKPYSYSIPQGMKVVPGSIVRVPLGPREVAGIVWDGDGGEVDPHRLRPISQVFDCPPIDAPMRRLVDWIAGYTLTPPGMVARMLLRAPEAFDPEPWIDGVRASGIHPERLTEARRRVLALSADGLAWTRLGLAHAAGVSVGVVDGLSARGALEPIRFPPPPVVAPPDPEFAAPRLSPDQQTAVAVLRSAVKAGHFS